ncbi:hypothetical protein [Catenuloplanes atrovinosus]|uniref:Lipoprotein n=1 Tax=Catenuloplanes atrovinosus TaxID=137266 RepID=A0AAE4CCY8_9ACTN|nr:hypothetical protein [Catenuloplanes atrovinosus]MDR7279658.1 hypothetical protein [Catenuloplanes atrovinosus]
MRTPRMVSITAVLTSFLLLSAGCGGGATPQAWASAVCQALGPWRTEISTLTTRAQQQMSAETTPSAAQENLARLFQGARDASETARQGVERAGVPDVEDGESVAKGFLTSLEGVRAAYDNALTGVKALDTTKADAFYAGVEQVVATLDTEYDKTALDTSSLKSEELREAFDQVPECR